MKKLNVDTSEYLEECFGYPCFDCREMAIPLTENEDDIGKNNAVRVMIKKVPNYDNTFETENEYVFTCGITDMSGLELKSLIFTDCETFSECFDFVLDNINELVPSKIEDYVNIYENLQ